MKGCRVLEASEIHRIMAELAIRDKALVMTSLTFGTRVSEALSLRFGEVEGDYLSIRSKKGSDNCTFPVPDGYKAIIAGLREHYQAKGIEVTSDTPLFLSQKGKNKAITRQQASQIVKKASAGLGLSGKINTHSFRKSFVTRIYELSGKDLAETKVYSRHKSLGNLDYYIKTTGKTDLVNSLSWEV